jgi:predicted RND superfamily exporter protein
MLKWVNTRFWSTVASLILRNRIVCILLIVATTVFLGMQWKNMRFSFNEASLLPDNHPFNLKYQSFVDRFGDEGNLIVLAIQDSTFFRPENIQQWSALTKSFENHDAITTVSGIGNLKQLKKNIRQQNFVVEDVPYQLARNQKEVDRLKKQLLEKSPFFHGVLLNPETEVYLTILTLKKEIVNAKERELFVNNELVPKVLAFEADTGFDIHVSGMPYIRTINAGTILSEIRMFVIVAALVTTLIFFFFFKSYRATFISMVVVVIGVMWAFGILGLFGFEITVLTALIPPIVIVIGVPNCIFLINKYQHEIKKHGNQARSLQRVITKIGNATLMTNMTTALGFATFTLTNSKLLIEFGLVAAVNIMLLFILSLFVIPILYSYMSLPQQKHLAHLNRNWMNGFIDWMEKVVRQQRVAVYFTSVITLMMSIIGIYQIKLSGTIIDDLPKKANFFEDIQFFESQMSGVMPIEVMVDTKRKNGATQLSTLNRVERLAAHIRSVPELSEPLSIAHIAKYAKQTYYNGNPRYFSMPTRQEYSFVGSYVNNSLSAEGMAESLIDSTGQYLRVTTMLKDVNTERMEEIESDLLEALGQIFPAERFDTQVTGKALGYLKGTRFLVRNLVLSLSLAILLIAIFMAYLFGSFRMILISLIPNIIPLILTAGMMGFLGIPIKPSTILVFSVAFGISVDDTIHFLVKYRQELQANKWKIKKSVYLALRETGVSMFYTSIVLFFGFSVFMISSYGGTVALGGLVSATLLFAMLANLILLPSLLLSLEESIANERILKEPRIDLLAEDEDR